MNPHELRVGNWVYEDKNPQDVGNPIGPWIYQMEAKDIQFADWYEPIPLDEKWLKRAGFSNEPFKIPHQGTGRWIWSKDGIELEREGGGYWSGDKKIEYVQELQNYYAEKLGKELEINVPVA